MSRERLPLKSTHPWTVKRLVEVRWRRRYSHSEYENTTRIREEAGPLVAACRSGNSDGEAAIGDNEISEDLNARGGLDAEAGIENEGAGEGNRRAWSSNEGGI